MYTALTIDRFWVLGNNIRLVEALMKTQKGQALVEFTLCFILMIVVAWIPADFGLMFYTGHIGQNAAREGARVAAADPTVDGQVGTCTVPCTAGDILQRISNRMAVGVMSSGASITLATSGTVAACDKQVSVTVNQTYYPSFYKILRFMGFSVPDSVSMTRTATMRYEHQC